MTDLYSPPSPPASSPSTASRASVDTPHKPAARTARARPAASRAQPKAGAAAAAPGTIYDALREAHALQRQLCARLVRLSARNPQGRLAVAEALRIELAAHAAAEERFLYVPMLMDDRGLDPSRHALSEHHDIDELVEDLQALAPDGEAWHAKAAELAHKVRHHLKEEETKFFQMSGKILTEPQKLQLAKRYQRDHDRMQRKLAAA